MGVVGVVTGLSYDSTSKFDTLNGVIAFSYYSLMKLSSWSRPIMPEIMSFS